MPKKGKKSQSANAGTWSEADAAQFLADNASLPQNGTNDAATTSTKCGKKAGLTQQEQHHQLGPGS
jgi:hypothetical protein